MGLYSTIIYHLLLEQKILIIQQSKSGIINRETLYTLTDYATTARNT